MKAVIQKQRLSDGSCVYNVEVKSCGFRIVSFGCIDRDHADIVKTILDNCSIVEVAESGKDW